VKGRWRRSRQGRFIELGFADALAALQSGKIDAMVGAEPFGTAAIAAGFPAIDSPYIAMSKKSMLTSAYFTFENPLKDNPELFKNIRAAVNESLDYAQKIRTASASSCRSSPSSAPRSPRN
jgi:NitT/TauT family transport system substrate-binding protein